MTIAQDRRRIRLAVLISGGGTTLKNLIDKIADGSLDAEIRLVVSSTLDARGLEFARQAQIPTLIARRGRELSPKTFSQVIFNACREAGVELVVMGGFLKHVVIPVDFANRVMNIHPALIPAFCGKGFYGLRVHQAVLDYGAKVSGCTVHFADNDYDHGPIILQRTVEVRDEDDAQSLAHRIFAQECEAYPEAIRLFAAGRLQVVGRRVVRRG